MTKPVIDTHRFMYRNCVLQAFSLSAPTQAIPFVEIDAEGAENEIPVGTSVWTNEAGYVFYGEGTQIVGSLAVPESAIIRVMQGTPLTQRAQFIVKVNADDSLPVTPEQVGTIYSYDGGWSWNPLGGDGRLPDFIVRGEFSPGTWAEGELVVDELTPTQIPIDKWTNSVIFRIGAGTAYSLDRNTGRYGQTITMFNMAGHDVSVHTIGSDITSVIKPGSCVVAIHLGGVWLVGKDATDAIQFREQVVGDNGTANITQSGFQIVKINSTYQIFVTANDAISTSGVFVNTGSRPVQIVPQGPFGARTVIDANSCMPFTIADGKLCMPKNPNYYSYATIHFDGLTDSNLPPNVIFSTSGTGIDTIGIGYDGYNFEVSSDPQPLALHSSVNVRIQVPKAWFLGRELKRLRIMWNSNSTHTIPACTVNITLACMDLGDKTMALGTHTIKTATMSEVIYDQAVTVEAD